MNSYQWERARKIAQEIHAADVAWSDALKTKLEALEVKNYAVASDAEGVMINANVTMARSGAALATLVLELGSTSPLGISDPTPDYLTSTDALEQIAGDSFWENINHQTAHNAMSLSAEDEEWSAYNSARRLSAYEPRHPGFKRVLSAIQEHPALQTPEQDETLPSDVLGQDFHSDYAEWFFESGEFPAISGDEGIAS